MTISIRTATQADASVLAALSVPIQRQHAQSRPDLFKPSTPTADFVAYYEDQLARPDTTAFVAEVDGQPAGYAVAVLVDRPENPFTYAFRYVMLDALSVNPDQQRRGIGTALMASVATLARNNGIDRIRLDVYSFNEAALAFYARQGFFGSSQRLELTLSEAQDIDAMG